MSKPQDTPIDSKTVVKKGDSLETEAKHLTDEPMTIEWSQMWFKRSETYYYIVFKNATQGHDPGRLWVSQKSLQYFKHNPESKDGILAFKVDEDFQYGQENSEGKNRFLVYHDKNNTPYQVILGAIQNHALLTALGDIVSSIGPGILKKASGEVENQLLKIFGDPLHNF
ncbi:uncharacterized protein KY384_000521 [Bacidia gigantensis]|uniref:uncharacterized protein n=1 Tax=Bacidia gigantensis TaxID=2732470 RepID=UPI001D03CBD3|nr:uncharacterized protein KY384_000521 [Bacidia gigantensis]KAG8525761.1 hypothetical protein KY384_000521 [Bacidia gigantensis]